MRSSSGRLSTGEVAGDVGFDDEDTGVCLPLIAVPFGEGDTLEDEAAGGVVVELFIATPFCKTLRSKVDAVAVVLAVAFFFFLVVVAFPVAPDVVAGGGVSST